MTRPTLSIGLCTYNRADFLPEVLAALKAQTLEPSLYELVVIDNNSKDETRRVVQQFAEANPQLRVRYFFEEKQGISHARNRAYLEANSDYVAYIDDDELAQPDWLESYHNATREHPGIAIYAGRIRIFYPGEKPDWASDYVEKWYGQYDFGPVPVEITEETIAQGQAALPNAGNMAVRVEFLKRIGGFDANLGRKGNQMLGGEETRIALTALEQGERMLYYPASLIDHVIFPERLSLEFLKEKHFMQGRSYSKLYRAELVRRGLPRLLAGKIVYWSRLLPGIFNRQHHTQLKTKLQFTFERGLMAGLLARGPHHA